MESHPPDEPDILGSRRLGRYQQAPGTVDDLLWISEAGITFHRPRVRPVPAGTLPPPLTTAPDVAGWDYWRLTLPFAPAADPGRAFTAVTVHLGLDPPDVESVLLDPARPLDRGEAADQGPGGVRLTTDCGWPGGSSLCWTLRDHGGGPLPPRGYLVTALIRTPTGIRHLAGALTARGTLRRRAPGTVRGQDVRPPSRLRFEVPLPGPRADGDPVAPTPPRAGSGAGPGIGQTWIRRLCLAAEVDGYGHRPVRQQGSARRRLVHVMEQACLAADLDRDGDGVRDRGDGRFNVLAAGLDEPRAVVTFLREVGSALRRLNDDLVEESRIRLRIALEQNPAPPAVPGTPVVIARMLAGEVLRARLRAEPAAVAAVALADDVYRLVADLYPDEVTPHRFLPADVLDPTPGHPTPGYRAVTWIGSLR